MESFQRQHHHIGTTVTSRLRVAEPSKTRALRNSNNAHCELDDVTWATWPC